MPQNRANFHLNLPGRPIFVAFLLPGIPFQLKPNNNGKNNEKKLNP
jgi:hypothetical protein